MTWNYRAVKNPDHDWFEIREVYYDQKGEPDSWTEAVEPCGDTLEELIADLEYMLKDAKTRPPMTLKDGKLVEMDQEGKGM